VEGGLAIPALSDKAEKMLKGKLLPEVALRNPVDVLATANAGHFRAVLDAMMEDEGIDSIYINFVTPFFVDCDSIARQIAESNGKHKKPIVCNLMTDKRERIETINILKEGNVPCFDFPGAAARALAALTRYGTILRREPGKVRSFEDVDRTKAAAILDKVLADGRTTLLADEAYGVLDAYAIPVAGRLVASDADEAATLATRLGFPVAVKADSLSIIHKSGAGGVALDLKDAGAVRAAVEQMGRAIEDPNMRFLVQRYLPGGKEVIVGARAAGDGLGHIVMCGLGGIHVEVLKDVRLMLSPVTDV
jgi:acetyltransferase